jgi:DNA-binding FrmR family transcriptional regulator
MRGYTPDKDALLKRLRRIEGQVRHLRHCVHNAITAADGSAEDKITEAADAVRRLVRS